MRGAASVAPRSSPSEEPADVAFTYGGQIGSSVNDTSGTSVLNITVGAGGVPAGALVCIGASKSTTVASITATDTPGNTYSSPVTNSEAVDTQTVSFIYAILGTGLVNGDTIPLTFGTGFSVKLAQAHYWTATGTIAFGSSSSADSTFPHTTKANGALTATAGDAVIGFWVQNSAPTTLTPAAGFTQLVNVTDGSISSNMGVYQLNVSAGSITPTGTVSSGSSSAGVDARFTETAAPADMTPKPALAGLYDPDLLSEMWF